MLQVDPIQSYLNLKIGLPPVLKAGSSGKRKAFTLRLRFSQCLFDSETITFKIGDFSQIFLDLNTFHFSWRKF